MLCTCIFIDIYFINVHIYVFVCKHEISSKYLSIIIYIYLNIHLYNKNKSYLCMSVIKYNQFSQITKKYTKFTKVYTRIYVASLYKSKENQCVCVNVYYCYIAWVEN